MCFAKSSLVSIPCLKRHNTCIYLSCDGGSCERTYLTLKQISTLYFNPFLYSVDLFDFIYMKPPDYSEINQIVYGSNNDIIYPYTFCVSKIYFRYYEYAKPIRYYKPPAIFLYLE